MVTSRSSTGTMARAILGVSGNGDDWSQLRDHLQDVGYQVDLFDATPSGETYDPEAILPLRSERVEVAFLVVENGENGAAVSSDRLIHLSGVLQGRLDGRRLVVLQEVGVDPFLHSAGVTELAFERGAIQSRFDEVDSYLRDLAMPGVPPTTPWMERFGIDHGRVPPGTPLVLGILAAMAAIVFVFASQFLGPSDAAQSTTAPTVSSTAPAGPSLSTVTQQPASPGPLAGEEAGAVDGLPARCFVDISEGVSLGDVLGCEGVGGLQVVGFRGPWHDNIAELTVAPGVVGQLNFESPPASGVDQRAQITAGERQSVTQVRSEFGIDSIELQFSENGQQVTFFSDDGQDMTLVFLLEL